MSLKTCDLDHADKGELRFFTHENYMGDISKVMEMKKEMEK